MPFHVILNLSEFMLKVLFYIHDNLHSDFKHWLENGLLAKETINLTPNPLN